MRWTMEQKQFLKDNYNVLSIEQLEIQLKRKKSAIYSQVAYLRKRGWTFENTRDREISHSPRV